jgi:putative lipoprotein
MKSMMGFGFFLLFLAGIALVMLQGRQMAQQKTGGGGAEMTGIAWRPTVIGADSMPADSGMFVQFEVDGSIKGHGGCNGFFGSLEETDTGIKVGPLGATRMACEEQVMDREQAFMTALQDGRAFEMGANRLQVLDADGTLLVELVPG